MLSLTPVELDAQSPIKVERWVDIDSREMQEMDDMPTLTRNWLQIGMKQDVFKLDSQGRVWYQINKNEPYQPFTFTYYGREIGIRMSVMATN